MKFSFTEEFYRKEVHYEKVRFFNRGFGNNRFIGIHRENAQLGIPSNPNKKRSIERLSTKP